MARVLIIDDNHTVREMIRGFLADTGHTIDDAENGQIAQRILDKEPIDLVITDIFMPEKEGLEVIHDIRHGARSIAIIAISGSSLPGAPDVLKFARELGANATLTKPFTREQLLEAVNSCLSAGQTS